MEILDISKKYLGLKETPGPATNPIIADWFKLVKLDGNDDSTTPWCAVFINGILNECKILGTGLGTARSFLEWGFSVIEKPIPGDICIFKRGDTSWQGHVGILIQYSTGGKSILIRGGNQNNGVSEEWFSVDKLIDIRRASNEFSA